MSPPVTAQPAQCTRTVFSAESPLFRISDLCSVKSPRGRNAGSGVIQADAANRGSAGRREGTFVLLTSLGAKDEISEHD